MENLDFGWQFAILALLLGIVYYLVVAAINYTLVIFLGRFLKRFTDQITLSKKNGITQLGIPFFLSAIIIVIAKIYIFGLFHNFLLWNSIFLDPSYFHLPVIYAYVTGMTCLSLTGYSFSGNWLLLGRLKGKRFVFNFIIWTTITLLITSLFRGILSLFLPEFFGYAVIYPGLIVLFTYLFLKRRNLNQPTL